jgi:hypothetical protein
MEQVLIQIKLISTYYWQVANFLYKQVRAALTSMESRLRSYFPSYRNGQEMKFEGF